MGLQLFEDELGDPRNAQYLATASDHAYLPESEGSQAYKDQLGLETKLISAGHTQCWAGTNDDHIVLAFRGTESPTSIDGLKDCLLADAMNLLILPEGQLGTDLAAAGVDARFHKGFVDALASIWEPVFAYAEAQTKEKDRPLWITGHSLGGALALLSAWVFKRRFVNVHQVYTFGAPMIGNKVASAAFDSAFPDKVFRFVNLSDPVPMLPMMSLLANDFHHCQKNMDLGEGEAGGLPVLLKDFAGKATDGLLSGSLVTDFWAAVLARVAAHGCETYRKALKDRFG